MPNAVLADSLHEVAVGAPVQWRARQWMLTRVVNAANLPGARRLGVGLQRVTVEHEDEVVACKHRSVIHFSVLSFQPVLDVASVFTVNPDVHVVVDPRVGAQRVNELAELLDRAVAVEENLRLSVGDP